MKNKTRAFLTMLGVVIGISSVITMVSLGQSSQASINKEISSMGTNLIMVMRAHQQRGGVNIGSANVQSLKVFDVQAIKEKAKYVSKVSPFISASGQLVYASKNWPGTLQGGNEDLLSIRKYELAAGSNFSASDVASYSKVCIIGKTVADNLFQKGENPIGKNIRFGRIPFMVIGVLASKGRNQMGQDQDDVVITPYSTIQKRILAVDFIHIVMASASSEELADAASREISNILRETHHIATGQDADFEVHTQQEMLEMINSVSRFLTILLAAIASISLIVGGIGIMNIMYVTVTERTKEIGLKMSIGARNRDILLQFLCESAILSLMGGIIGIILGLVLSHAVCHILNWETKISAFSIVISFFVCSIIGIFFGWYPAKKAASLDPIHALRYE